jgi:beta-lactamase class A
MRSGRLTSSNGDHRFPLASVCKIPIAMNLLAQVDEGRRALDEEIEVLPGDVVRSVSPLAERWPAEKRFRLREMVELMVAKSDNTAVETLYRVGGEGPALAARFRRWQVAGVRIDRSERQCAIDRHQSMRRFLNDPRDTGTPNGTARLLARLFRGETLSKPSTGLLIDALKATTTFPGRLKGLLPPGTTVAHKTGTTETVSGLTAATNDSGVIFLPDGGLLAVSVYIKASTRDAGARDRVIARIARAAFDHYGG